MMRLLMLMAYMLVMIRDLATMLIVIMMVMAFCRWLHSLPQLCYHGHGGCNVYADDDGHAQSDVYIFAGHLEVGGVSPCHHVDYVHHICA